MQIHDVKSEDANSFLIIMKIINNYEDILYIFPELQIFNP